jgi:hypothetical protein
VILKCDEEPTWESESNAKKSSGDTQNCDLQSVNNKKEKCNEAVETQLTNINRLMIQRVLCCFRTKRKKWWHSNKEHVSEQCI